MVLKILADAGFSRDTPNDILSGQSTIQDTNDYTNYNLKLWAQTRDTDGQTPLLIAVIKSLKWYYMKLIFTADILLISEIDAKSGLPLVLLDVTGATSNIESVYNLLKEFPGTISFNGHSHYHILSLIVG